MCHPELVSGSMQKQRLIYKLLRHAESCPVLVTGLFQDLSGNKGLSMVLKIKNCFQR